MGWGRMLLLGNVGQQLDIGDLNNAIAGMGVEIVSGHAAAPVAARGMRKRRKSKPPCVRL